MNHQIRIVKSVLAMLCATLLQCLVTSHAQAVDGYVDLHSHLTAEQSFGGGWFWGTINGPMETAVQRCDGNFLTHSHAATLFPIVSEFIGADTGWHLGKRRGYDRRRCKRFLGITIPGTCPKEHFEDWPKWNTIAHQQMWGGWLRQAHEGGLQVMLVSLAESNFLCINTALQSRRYGCDEMESVRRQAQFARNFANANSSWAGIAESPAQARALIAQGKLALVLAVEATKLFPTGDYLAQLDELRGLGVRSVQVTHHADNRFGGAAPIPKLMDTANLVESLWSLGGTFPINLTDIDDIVCRNSAGASGTCDGQNFLNERGLSVDGNVLVNAMMDRGMLLDVAHLSRHAFVDTYNLARAHGNYPLLYTHTHTWDTVSPDEERHEKYLRSEEIHMITDTGGMIGLRTGPESTVAYPTVGGPVSNDCQGSARSFAQSLMYAVDHGLNVGFGADFNGFIEQMKPRYRPLSLIGTGATCRSDTQQLIASNGVNDFRKKGLAHVGLFPQLIADLQAIGTPASYISQLNQSAEQFLRIWERSVSLSVAAPANLALSASSSASSTYCGAPGEHCYSPARINDGNHSTALGGFSSWTNDYGMPMPQWVQLTWGVPTTFSRLELYTTSGYVVRNFVIQYQLPPSSGGGWADLSVTPAFPTTNTSTLLSYTLPPVTTTAIRVLGRSGSEIQPGYVRVNEVEVYQ
jgi:microsomal dipeptidase-like Zn-dependent dipeptidase